MRIITLILILLICSQCAVDSKVNIKTKDHPEYDGIPDEIKTIYDEFLRLSARNNIAFTNKVTVGFKEINHGKTIGLCHYGKDFREIDLDKVFWNKTSILKRKALLFHELIHCYCQRSHDYGDGQLYEDDSFDGLLNIFNEIDENAGRYADKCPLSIMYPVIMSESCMEKHYSEYIKEMFRRCDPY